MGDFGEMKQWVGKSYAFAIEKKYKNDELRASRKVAKLMAESQKRRIENFKSYLKTGVKNLR